MKHNYTNKCQLVTVLRCPCYCRHKGVCQFWPHTLDPPRRNSSESSTCAVLHFCLVEGFVFCFEHLLVDSVPEHTVLPLSPVPHSSLYSQDEEPVSKREVTVEFFITYPLPRLAFFPAIPQSLLLNSVFFLSTPSLDESQTLFGKSFVGKTCACWKSGQETSGSGPVLGWLGYNTEKDVKSYSDAVCSVHGRYGILLLKSPLQLGLRTGTINCTPG